MTQAFNLSQLANNLNTSGQLDATDGLNGLVANANLASSGSASSSTFLRGDRTWAVAGLLAATTAEAQAWTSNTVAITPLALANAFKGSNQSFASAGYQKLPGGTIIQWGEYTATMTHTTQYTATFPIAFPTSCAQVIGYVGQTVTTGVTPVNCPEVSHSTTSFTFQYGTVNGASYTTTVHYIAIGY